MLTVTVMTMLAGHFIGTLMGGATIEKIINRIGGPAAEQMRQHHEKCIMLGLIALAIIFRG